MQTTPGEPTPTCPDRPPHRGAACCGLLSVVTTALFAACGTDAGSSDATLDIVRAATSDSDNVWAVTEGEQGVERVVRYRIQTGRP